MIVLLFDILGNLISNSSLVNPEACEIENDDIHNHEG